jgi:hypothetical protein
MKHSRKADEIPAPAADHLREKAARARRRAAEAKARRRGRR